MKRARYLYNSNVISLNELLSIYMNYMKLNEQKIACLQALQYYQNTLTKKYKYSKIYAYKKGIL